VYMKAKYTHDNRKKKNKYKQRSKRDRHCLREHEQLAAEIDMICRRILPDNRIQFGALAGSEPEIRQNALIMALGGFLAGNPEYARARKSNDSNAIRPAVERTDAIALQISKMRLGRELVKQFIRHTQLSEHTIGECRHPSEIQPVEWPWEVQQAVMMKGLARAVSHGKLSPSNAWVFAMRVGEGLTVQEISKILKVTPGAVYQQIDRVRAVLPEMLDGVEVSFV